jgi:hypothetical protein
MRHLACWTALKGFQCAAVGHSGRQMRGWRRYLSIGLAVSGLVSAGSALGQTTVAFPVHTNVTVPPMIRSEGHEETPSAGDLFTGPYGGFEFSGYSAGVVTANGVLGYNGLLSNNVLIGGHVSAGVQFPTNRTELWAGLNAGPVIKDRIWFFGTAEAGMINNIAVYGGGAGVQYLLFPGLALAGRGIVRGPFGGPPTEFGVTGGFNWYPGQVTTPTDLSPIGTHTDWYPVPSFRLGVEVLYAPTAGVVTPAVSGMALFPVGNGINVGVRASGGVQIPTGKPEIMGGGQVGIDIGPIFHGMGYVFAEGGFVGNTAVNSVGFGGLFDVTPEVSIGPEVFVRGPFGTFTEGGVRIGGYFKFDEAFREKHQRSPGVRP